MALKIELKPFERIIIGQSLITNSEVRARFNIEGDVPILREKDILTAETADTPVKQIYLCIQMMYLESDIPKYQQIYFDLIRDVIQTTPSFKGQIELASNDVLAGKLYKALKEIKKLIPLEDETPR